MSDSERFESLSFFMEGLAMDWKETAESIIHEVAADDIDTASIVIAEPSELGLSLPSDVGGLHSPMVYSLASCDPAGFACVVEGAKFNNDRERIGAVLHELGHRLDNGPLELPDDGEPPTQTERDELSILLQLILANRSRHIERTKRPRWYQHEHRFVIACSVLSHRVGQVCESIRPGHLRFSEAYSGVPENSWFSPLGDTVTRSGSIREIIAEPPPEAFQRAWQSITGETINDG